MRLKIIPVAEHLYDISANEIELVRDSVKEDLQQGSVVCSLHYSYCNLLDICCEV